MLFNRLNLNNPTESHGDRTSVEYSSQAHTASRRNKPRHEPISISLDFATKRDFRYSPDFPSPQHHLKGKEKLYYTSVPPLENLPLFRVALELFNRKGVRPMRKGCTGGISESGEICQYFFESVGKAKVTPKLCTECRDVEKNRKRYDFYYVDLVEIATERTVRCSECMYQLLKKHISGSEEGLKQELRFLRSYQADGVLVDPFLISCGH